MDAVAQRQNRPPLPPRDAAAGQSLNEEALTALAARPRGLLELGVVHAETLRRKGEYDVIGGDDKACMTRDRQYLMSSSIKPPGYAMARL